MAESIDQYRSAVQDALGRPIPDEGELRVWLDDDTVDRTAPDGWIHLVTAREVCFLLPTGRVVELSLDSDLDGDVKFGQGKQVVDFLLEQNAIHGRALWPRDGLSVHSANPTSRDAMAQAIRTQASRFVEVEQSSPGGQPHFQFREVLGSD